MLSSSTIDLLLGYATEKAPIEMCGLMFSYERFVWCANSAADPTRSFELSYQAYHVACRSQGEQPWAIVHSHPGRSAALSPKDCSLMDALQLAKLNWDCIIVGMDPVEVRCWRKKGALYALAWKRSVGPRDDAPISSATSV